MSAAEMHRCPRCGVTISSAAGLCIACAGVVVGADERIRRDREWTASTLVAALINRLGGIDQVIAPHELQSFRSSMPVLVTHMPDGSIMLQINEQK